MSNLSKVRDHLGEILYERLSSPFAQSFLIAWIFFNRDYLLFLFSSGHIPFDERQAKLAELLNWGNGLFHPLWASFASIILYVFASWLAHYIWERFLVAKQNSRGHALRLKKMDEEDEIKLRQTIKNLGSQLWEQQKNFRDQISNLEDELSKSKKENEEKINEYEYQIQKLTDEVDDSKRLINKLQDSTGERMNLLKMETLITGKTVEEANHFINNILSTRENHRKFIKEFEDLVANPRNHVVSNNRLKLLKNHGIVLDTAQDIYFSTKGLKSYDILINT